MKKLTVLTFVLVWVLSAVPPVTAQMNPAAQQRAMQAAELYQNAANALRMRRLTEARAMLQKLIQDYPQEFYAGQARRMLVEIMRDLNEHTQAIAMLKEMVKDVQNVDNQAWARQTLCALLYDLQRFREGIELLEEWRKSATNDIWLERELARFYLQAGRKDEAWMLLETMLERTAAPAIFNELLELALKSGEIEKLLKTLDDRRARFRSRDYSSFAADCYIAMSRKDKAIEVIRATPDLDREWLLLEKLSDLLVDTDRHAEALEVLQKLNLLVPNNWNTIKKLGHCLVVLKRVEEAKEVWRKPFEHPHFQRQDQYMNYTTVLIEHQMYEEALAGFQEARKKLGDSSIFAEETATVLEALGRKSEALDEYVQTFVKGHFRLEVFDRLYENDSPGFNLEQRLRDQLKKSYSIPLRQALLELYFRRQNDAALEKLVAMMSGSEGFLDDFFFERLNQDTSVFADNFHFELCRHLLNARSDSTLALRLAAEMIQMAVIEPIFAEVAMREAGAIAKSQVTADAELKARLLLEAAEFAFKNEFNPVAAHEFIDQILQTSLLRAAPQKAVEAAILKAHIMIAEENYQQAEALLAENHRNVEKARENIFAANPIGETDYIARILLEQAYLALNQDQMQKALDHIKTIVETMPESIWTNDALAMALLITRTSVGDFSLIRNLMKARRLAAVGKSEAAAAEYQQIVSNNASLTVLIEEVEAEQLLRASRHESGEQVLKKLTELVSRRPDHFMSADLMERKLYYLRLQKAGEKEVRELMQKFIDRFPNDLRSGRFKKLIEKNSLIIHPPVKKVAPQKGEKEDVFPLIDGSDADLDQVVPQPDLLDLDEMGDY